MKTKRHTLVLPCAATCDALCTHRHVLTYNLCGVQMTKMGNTSLDIKAFSEQLLQQQLHQRPVCTFQSIPRGERWSERERGGGGGGKWQKIGDAELTVKHRRGRVVVLWKCSLFSSAQRNLSTGGLTFCTQFCCIIWITTCDGCWGDARMFGSDGFAGETTLHKHIILKYCNWGGVLRYKHHWSALFFFFSFRLY